MIIERRKVDRPVSADEAAHLFEPRVLAVTDPVSIACEIAPRACVRAECVRAARCQATGPAPADP